LRRILDCGSTGFAEAAHLASLLYAGGIGARLDHSEGLRWLVEAARLGHVRAIAQIGVLQGTGHRDGLELLRRAARAGWMVAMYALARALSDTAEGRYWMSAAAAAGHPYATGTGTPAPAAVAAVGTDPDWRRLPEAIDLSWVRDAIRRTVELREPHIETIERFLPLPVCDYVVGMAAPALQRARVLAGHGGEVVSAQRTNAVMTFGLADSDFLLELVNVRAAAAAGMPPQNAEGLGVLHYRPGESYAAHADYIPETPENAAQLAARGQRVKTLLVYLNADFTGGETEFPLLHRHFRPPAGSALLFHNVDDRQQVERRSLHAGTPPAAGEKWVISKWFRSKELRPAAAASDVADFQHRD
jgi:prolyl 4-hydroxylase